MFERAADLFFSVMFVAAVVVAVSPVLIFIWDELICRFWKFLKESLGPSPLSIGLGDRVRATRDFKITNPDIDSNVDRNIEGVVIEVDDEKLHVRADDGQTYDCFSAGATRLEDKPEFVTKLVATQTLNSRWQVRKLGHMFPVGDGANLEQALRDLDDKLPVPCTGSCEIIKQYDPLV